MYRREFGRLVLASIPFSMPAASIKSVYGGVHVGGVAYNYPDLPRIPGAKDQSDAWIQVFRDVGFGEIELSNPIVEPPAQDLLGRGQSPANTQQARQEMREKLRQWRLTTPLSHFRAIRNKFNRAGIEIFVYTCNGMGDDFTETEIDRLFAQAKAFGVKIMASSTRLSVAQKLVPFAEKHKIMVAFHGHSNPKNDPDEFASPESFQKAWEMSRHFMTNLDIGHFVAANFDPVAFIQKNHARITHLHIKDRKKDHGPNLPWGQGDTPIKEVLQLVKKNKYPIRCDQEFEYKVPEGSSCAAEWKKCREYLIEALA